VGDYLYYMLVTSSCKKIFFSSHYVRNSNRGHILETRAKATISDKEN
jgi:hypothetical protein